MRSPIHYLQVERDTIARARELAALLRISHAEALAGLLMLWDASLNWTPQDRAPDGVLQGVNALRRVAAAFGWQRPEAELTDALVELGWGEYLQDGYRLRGVEERYAEAWQKATGLSLARAEAGRAGGLRTQARKRAEFGGQSSKAQANAEQRPSNGKLDVDGERDSSTAATSAGSQFTEIQADQSPSSPQEPPASAAEVVGYAHGEPQQPRQAATGTDPGEPSPLASESLQEPARPRLTIVPDAVEPSLPDEVEARAGLSERDRLIVRFMALRDELQVTQCSRHRFETPELAAMLRDFGFAGTELRYRNYLLTKAVRRKDGTIADLAKEGHPWTLFRNEADRYGAGPTPDPREAPPPAKKAAGAERSYGVQTQHAPEGVVRR